MDKCKRCGCSKNNPCENGCFWVGFQICSSCTTEFELSEYNRAKNEELEKFRKRLEIGGNNE